MISDEQFQAALQRLELGDFVRAEPVSFGLFGQNVFVTSTKGEFVLRGLPHYPWQFPTEVFFVELLHQRTQLPVPYPYLLEPSTDIFGWSFVLMPRLNGLQMQDPVILSHLSPADRLEVPRALARALLEIQTITWDCAGAFDPDTGQVKPFEPPYSKHILQKIRGNMAACRTYNDHTTDSDLAWIESILSAALPFLDLPHKNTVVHADYGEHNSLLSRTASGWEVSAVFDWMTAHMGEGQSDLSSPVMAYMREDEALADAFVHEYLREKGISPGFAALQQFYMLDLSLNTWRHWQRNHNGVPGEAETLTFVEYASIPVNYWKKYI